VVIQRPALYVERRTDGYREPQVILILGTAHLSAKSACDAERVVAAVQPQNVVVELCRSRAGIMYEEPGSDGAASKGQWQAGWVQHADPSNVDRNASTRALLRCT
jgi:hypothetical protein